VVSGAGVGRRRCPAEVAERVEADQAAGDQRPGVVEQRLNAAKVVVGDVEDAPRRAANGDDPSGQPVGCPGLFEDDISIGVGRLVVRERRVDRLAAHHCFDPLHLKNEAPPE
jgi:hypothetical protein